MYPKSIAAPGTRSRLRHEALENLRRRQPENLRTEHAEDRADRAGQDDHDQRSTVRIEIGDQASEGALEVLRLLRGHAEAANHPAAEHVARRRRALRRLLLQRQRRGRR